MHSTLRQSLTMLVCMTALCGCAYPVFTLMFASLAAPDQRQSSTVTRDGRVIGSSLVGQSWKSDRYFHGRPSAVGCEPLPSGGTNRTIASAQFRTDVRARRDSLAAYFGVAPTDVPSDMVTASASGIDPHISVEAALIQIQRVASARGMGHEQISELVDAHTEQPLFGIFGRARVNVLRVNDALDRMTKP